MHERERSGAHSCTKYGHQLHVTCELQVKGGEEGFALGVMCSNYDNETIISLVR